ncbi:MAG: DnaB-like helicase N-terminal domain-containing protein, partial [bacterium]|nr:DnaB-like helicase N-terminal domain-containing protein [bacterium]
MNDRIPPHNLEAEASLLGAILIDPESIIKIADIVRQEDFYRDIHAKIYKAMVELYSKHEPIDVLSLGNRLTETR